MDGLKFSRRLTKGDEHYKTRVVDARIVAPDGRIVFEQHDVEIPETWSQRAANIVASQYFRGKQGTPERESSFSQVLARVLSKIREWGRSSNYFADVESEAVFYDELFYVFWNQMAAFNSPVWYNLGVEGSKQQGSACFIGSVDDDMESITDRLKIEARVFKWGSGFGCNNSNLRGSMESLSYGGTASGPVSFMLVYDANAEVVRSAGIRRAAKMELLDVDHPDIFAFIMCKGDEEQIGKMIKEKSDFDSINQTGIRHQNANHSVVVTDTFMKAVENDDDWHLTARQTGEFIQTVKARDILTTIAKYAWMCGDPGLFYEDNVNAWHTHPSWGRIRSCNPCSEFVQPPWSACNLASFNIWKFFCQNMDDCSGMFGDVTFDIDMFEHVVRLLTTAMDIIAGHADYPEERIAENSRKYRPLGLGYSNLGALLVRMGLPYDSDEGRNVAAGLTSVMTAFAYDQSAVLNRDVHGRFARWDSKEAMHVLKKHRLASVPAPESYKGIPGFPIDWDDIVGLWINTLLMADANGLSNTQVTLLAPTGTISFLMDCETTGIEPFPMLGGVKKMADGGEFSFTLPDAVLSYVKTGLGVDLPFSDEGNGRLEWTLSAEQIDHLKSTNVLDTAMGGMDMRTIHYMGHVKMMAAVQPFLSGAISKTVNLPKETTEEEIYDLYLTAWKAGLKSIAIYRDGSKFEQPLNLAREEEKEEAELPKTNGLRLKLPDDRDSKTHKFQIGQHKGYITTGLYPDGDPGEIFIVMNKQGSTVRGLLDTIATLVSMCLQYGVPLEDLIDKFKGVKFEPQGMTRNRDILFAQSPVDYIFRYLENKFIGIEPTDDEDVEGVDLAEDGDDTGDPCPSCGSIMIRRGTCNYCDTCDITTGCS